MFGLSPCYDIHTAREAQDWFLRMMREHEEFEVETDRAGELPIPFWSETVSRVVLDQLFTRRGGQAPRKLSQAPTISTKWGR